MRDHSTRRPIPIEQSILWKPLHDSHYVVASLQPSDGGRRKIFIRQRALGRIEALIRAHGRRTYGLLLGQFYHCPDTGLDYLVIESVAEQTPSSDETDMAAGIGEALAAGSQEQRAHVMGWFRGVAAVEAKPSPTTAATHTTLLDRPWQATLVVGEGAPASSGAFFLHDTTNSRWFCTPFYELLDHATDAGQPKPTLVNWPHQYITMDTIKPANLELIAKVELADVRSTSKFERNLARASSNEVEVKLPPPKPVVDIPVIMPTAEPRAQAIEPAVDAEVRPLTDRPALRPMQGGLADVHQPPREGPVSRRSSRSAEKLSIVDDRDQRLSATSRRIADADDTTAADDPGRYIELARTEGFFIAAKFETISGMGAPETLWVLNEPYSGMLLSVSSTGSEVVDATLHYNLQTDDAGLRRVPFPEHRDEASKTIYARETCVDSLRARCRRLRATNALVREWKVTPAIPFLTPAEWEFLPSAAKAGTREGAGAGDLSEARIAELPAGVRTQFHLGPVSEAGA